MPAVGIALMVDREKRPSEKTANGVLDEGDSLNGLQLIPIKSPGFFGRLLRRKVPENAYAEVQNLLAGARIRDVPEDAVERILSEYELTVMDARPRLRELYATVLGYIPRDQELTDAEVDDLRRLKHLLALTDHDIRDVEAAVLGGAYERALLGVLADGRLTPEEQAQLAQIAQRLRLPDAVAEEVRKREGKAALEALPHPRRRGSPARARGGGAVGGAREGARSGDQLRCQDARQPGAVPAALADRPGRRAGRDGPELRLQRGERAHFHVPASRHELRTVTKRIRYGGPTARIRMV